MNSLESRACPAAATNILMACMSSMNSPRLRATDKRGNKNIAHHRRLPNCNTHNVRLAWLQQQPLTSPTYSAMNCPFDTGSSNLRPMPFPPAVTTSTLAFSRLFQARRQQNKTGKVHSGRGKVVIMVKHNSIPHEPKAMETTHTIEPCNLHPVNAVKRSRNVTCPEQTYEDGGRHVPFRRQRRKCNIVFQLSCLV